MPSNFNAGDAERYERLMGRWSRRLAVPFLEFAGLEPGERVLEVGCGTGSLTERLAASPVAAVEALDYAEVFLEAARARITDPRVRFRQGDACALPFPDAGFDRALSLLVLHFVSDARQAMAEMARVVRPGGVVAAAVWDAYGGMPHQRLLTDLAAMLDPEAAKARDHAVFRPMTRPDELRATWAAMGLEAEQTLLTIRVEFADFEDYWGPMASGEGNIGRVVAGFAPELRERVRKAVHAAYLCGQPDGPRSFPASAWACRAVRPG
ncbi:MAG TPA: class I SAM-dependent methyltransferase [Crenalkalicoccus sp.]|nr:class I SAM-dependent methyltransferase [Crenalkalicoccus sp.]